MTTARPWYESFFEGLYGRVLGAIDPKQSQEEATLIRRLAKLRKGERVLDVPCGQGRVTLPLANAGLRMTGVDLTKSYIETAKRAARRQGLSVQFMQGDMREIGYDGEFDGALNWFGSFGYFSDRENLDFLTRVHRALKPGGRFVIEGLNKSWLLANFLPERERTSGGIAIRTHGSWNARTNRVRDVWTLEGKEGTVQHALDMRIFNGSEIRALLRQAGFRDIQLYGYPPIGKLTRHSRRWVAVGEKR